MMTQNKNGYADNYALRGEDQRAPLDRGLWPQWVLDEIEKSEGRSYERGVTDGFAEAIYEVKRGEINPQTWVRPATNGKDK